MEVLKMTINNILTTEFNTMDKYEKIGYIATHGKLKVLTTYTKGGWYNIEQEAEKMGCCVRRCWDEDLQKQHKFNEYYCFYFKPQNKKRGLKASFFYAFLPLFFTALFYRILL